MVYYRKYRPQKIDELDSTSVRETLKSVLSSKKSNFHAFLFTGPKGLGKTSAARIIAKFLNCEKRKASDLEPCNRCYQCKAVANGTSLDVFEIDAASNRGIDEIRDLREKINLSTAGGKFKIYIIDEVHMLTAEAFNALLKTLEEPPSHAVFVLCTTEAEKVPATIASRCLHVSFSIATQDELLRSLKRIVNGENLKIDKEALEEIAKLSEGSFRDGSKILQELVAKAGSRKITKEFVEKKFKISNIKYQISNMIEFLEGKDVKSSLSLVQKLVSDGVEMRNFIEELVNELHGELLLQIQGKGETKFSLEELKKLLGLLMDASSQIKYAVLPQLPLELAIVEYCSDNVQSAVSTPVKQASSASAEASAPASGQPPSFLQELILKINSHDRTIAGLLRGVSLKDMNGKKIVMETKYKFHKEKLEERNAIDLIGKVASEILNKNVTIEFLLSSKG